METITEIMNTDTPDEKMYYVVAQLTATLKLLEEGIHRWPSWEDSVKPTRVANQASMAQNIVKKINDQLVHVESACDFATRG
ncbi:hypothetical protein N9Z65_00645 [bacterium]|nr:hypothetical protein [bacterium]